MLPQIFVLKCNACKREKSTKNFHKSSRDSRGYQYKCKPCQAKHGKLYICTLRGKEVIDRSNKKYRESEAGKRTKRILYEFYKTLPEFIKAERIRSQKRRADPTNRLKIKARYAVSNALRDGKITRPNQCSDCHKNRKVQAHHFLGYAPAHWLDIKWLCKKCHDRCCG